MLPTDRCHISLFLVKKSAAAMRPLKFSVSCSSKYRVAKSLTHISCYLYVVRNVLFVQIDSDSGNYKPRAHSDSCVNA